MKLLFITMLFCELYLLAYQKFYKGLFRLVLYYTRIERSGNDELVVDSWCRVVGGSEMNHVIDSEGKVKGGYVDQSN